MIWAKAAVAAGVLVLLATFAIGTENELSTPVMGQPHDCGPSISAPWLVSGTPGQPRTGPAAPDDEQRAAAACEAVVHRSRVLLMTSMGVGGTLALVGWTALVTRRRHVPGTVTPARAEDG